MCLCERGVERVSERKREREREREIEGEGKWVKVSDKLGRGDVKLVRWGERVNERTHSCLNAQQV